MSTVEQQHVVKPCNLCWANTSAPFLSTQRLSYVNLPQLFKQTTRRSKIVSRASVMCIEHLLCATVPKIAFVIVLKDACLKEISCNCNHTEIGVSLFTVKVSY